MTLNDVLWRLDVYVAMMVKNDVGLTLAEVRLERLRRVTFKKVLTVVLTSSILTTWSVFLELDG